ncbi:class I SAM-dependent methyltransferase [Sphingomonas sp. GCM10030256]|uniref:class I SAM-dependent methyltransferase n=1 Tax=Sphingomonas sp. GCM10030256 TaxID=3273427 RepID=UPI003614BD58
MIQEAFPRRDCPACGADEPRDEVFSDRRAEAISMDELKPFWSGLFKEKVFFTYSRCQSCEQMYAPHFFTNEQLGELYADMAPNMEDVPGPALEATQRGYWREAKKAAPLDGGFLEIGPDVGYIVRDAAREAGYDHYWLFEPNRAVHAELASATNGKPHTISTEMDDLSPVPDGSIGLAVMIHVLDHLLDPLAMLTQIRTKLKPGGTLMIVTHNEKSLLRSAMGVKFPPFCLQHPELYNPNSMTRLVKRAGYDTVKVGRSRNYFPIAFMVRQAAWTVGIDLAKAPLPQKPVGLKLGNMLTIAKVAG